MVFITMYQLYLIMDKESRITPLPIMLPRKSDFACRYLKSSAWRNASQ